MSRLRDPSSGGGRPGRWGQLIQLLFIAAAAVGAYSFVRAARHDHRLTRCAGLCELRPAYAGQDRRAPDFELLDLTGQPVRLSSFRGQTVVLSFWTESCKPCLEEMPSLAELAELVQPEGIAVVTVTPDDDPARIQKLLRRILKGAPLPFAVLRDPELDVITDKFGTTLYPETWLIDAAGIIRARFDGERSWNTPLAVDVVKATHRGGSGCPVEFWRGQPTGRFAALCGG